MDVYTIGFTQRSAEDFFGALKRAGIQRVLDVRLRNTGQLAGFSKRDDLAFFLGELCDAEYRHEPLLAPSDELLTDYRKHKLPWPAYEPRFRALMAERQVEQVVDRDVFSVPTVLLCTEPTPERCHRRLVLEYLQQHWGGLEVVHL